jgi:hypothetical protein
MFFEKIIYQNHFIKKYTKKQIGVIVSDFYTFLFFPSAPECSFVKKADFATTFVRFLHKRTNTNTSFCCSASTHSEMPSAWIENPCLHPHHPPLPQKEMRPAPIRPIDGRSYRKGFPFVQLHPPKRPCRGKQVQVDDLPTAAGTDEYQTPFVALRAYPIGNPAADVAFLRHLLHAFQGIAPEVPGEPRVDAPGKLFP